MDNTFRTTDSSGEPVSLGTVNQFEVYPMPIFVKIIVADVAAVQAWYERALGFATMFAMPPIDGQPSLVHLRRKKYQDVLLVRGQAAGAASQALTINFNTDDLDAVAEAARAAPPLGGSAVSGPVDTPWNTRDLTVTDPGGHQLVFTARLANPDPQVAARWKEIFDQAGKTRDE
jgi:uncharacterized glyoxalase superfamily protein PhnB